MTDFFGRLLRQQPLGAAAGVVLLGLIFVAVFAEQLTPHEYDIGRVQDRLQAPSAEHPLGTDHAGRDVLARILKGAQVSLLVGLMATLLNTIVALLVGGATGFIGGRVDIYTQRFVDAWMSFPGLLLLLTIMSFVDRSIVTVIVVLGVTGGIPASRVVRRRGDRRQGERLLPGRGGGRRAPALDPGAPRAAQHRRAADRDLQHQRRQRDHRRGQLELPRFRPAGERAELGRHAEPRRAAVHGAGAAPGAVARSVPDGDGVLPQHGGRRGPRTCSTRACAAPPAATGAPRPAAAELARPECPRRLTAAG